MAYELLATARVNRIMQGLRDARELPGNLLFLNRTPRVNATDGEILADFTGNVFAADIIADNQRAVVRNTGSFSLETVKLPNIKHGSPLTQEMINLLERINAGGAIRDDVGVVTNYLGRTLNNLLTGVMQTMEILRVGCALDTLSWNRGGVIFTASWGTPAVLKVTPGVTWATAATATPIADIQTQVAVRRETYGQPTNRITMTSVAFRQMIATVEFREKSVVYNQIAGLNAANFPRDDIGTMQQFAGRILGLVIELYDSKYFTQSNAGVTSSATNFLPDNKVLLSDSSADNDSSQVDIANGIVTESVVAGLTGTNFAGAGGVGGFGGPQYGPIGYVTLSSFDLNAPGVTAWAVARSFPRKKNKASESVLTIG